MLISVIRILAGVSLDGYDYFTYWCDRLVTICYVECYCCKVLIVVCELICGKIHICRAFFSSCCLSFSAECEVFCDIIQSVIRCCCVAFDLMLSSIVYICVVCTDDSYFCIDWSDLLIAVCYLEGYLSEILIVVGELCFCQAHVGLAVCVFTLNYVSSCSCSCTTECEVSFLVQWVIDLNIISTDTVLFSIVWILAGVSLDGYDYFIYRCDFLITICYIECHDEVLVVVDELLCLQAHICLTVSIFALNYVCSCSCCCSVE